jgi:hypothetical protein
VSRFERRSLRRANEKGFQNIRKPCALVVETSDDPRGNAILLMRPRRKNVLIEEVGSYRIYIGLAVDGAQP